MRSFIVSALEYRGIRIVVTATQTMSLWGQQATGLPIDFQVQSMTDANSIDGPRHPIGMS